MNEEFHEPLDLDKLDREYLGGVLANMRKDSTVRFGLTGTGNRRNYQVREVSEIAYRINHVQYSRVDSQSNVFKDNNLSRPFTYGEIRARVEGSQP